MKLYEMQFLIQSSNANYSPFQSESFQLICFKLTRGIDPIHEQNDQGTATENTPSVHDSLCSMKQKQQYFESLSFCPYDFHCAFYHVCNCITQRICWNLQEIFEKSFLPPIPLEEKEEGKKKANQFGGLSICERVFIVECA